MVGKIKDVDDSTLNNIVDSTMQNLSTLLEGGDVILDA